MTNLQQRIVTGTIFGVTLIGGILWSEYALTCIALFIIIVGSYELNNIFQKINIFPNKIFVFTGNISLFVACLFFALFRDDLSFLGKEILLIFSSFIGFYLLLFAIELFRNKEKSLENLGAVFFSAIYVALPIGLLTISSVDNVGNYNGWRVLFFFFFMWASDTGAYFSGRAFGKHKLFERLSPKKTIEGFIGGLITAGLVGIAAFYQLGTLPLWAWITTGIIMSITGTLGDLLESMLKRQTGIKDSGTILPGHGGILDRFDSTFFSAPVYWIILQLV
jgi:phosphatidate cytidylyltransferase